MTTNESHDLGTLFTFAGWFNGGGAAQRYLLELDGVDIWFDYTATYLEGLIGGQNFNSSVLGSGPEFVWTHMAVSYDGVNGYARTYIDGVNVSEDSVVATGADLNGIVSIAWDGTSNEFFGDWDDVHFYKAVLTDVQVDSLYTYPGIPIGGKTDPPIPSDSVDILYYEDFEDFAVTGNASQALPNGVLEEDLESNLTNFQALQSEGAYNNEYANNIDIVTFDGGTVLKSYYPEGQCCTGASHQSSFANGLLYHKG
jgi:hypothetical protein